MTDGDIFSSLFRVRPSLDLPVFEKREVSLWEAKMFLASQIFIMNHKHRRIKKIIPVQFLHRLKSCIEIGAPSNTNDKHLIFGTFA